MLLLRDFKRSLFFGVKMTHLTMLKYSTNELGYIQVVTNSDNKKELEGIGFVDHIDKVKKPKAKKETVKKVSKDA